MCKGFFSKNIIWRILGIDKTLCELVREIERVN